MSKFEERLQEKIPEAVPILRDLRTKAGILEDVSDEEICSLQEIFRTYEALMTNDYIKAKEQLREELADVRMLGNGI